MGRHEIYGTPGYIITTHQCVCRRHYSTRSFHIHYTEKTKSVQRSGSAGLQYDLIGTALNWARASAAGARDEANFEVFYRFPFFTGMDTTLSYQYVINPALTREFDRASVISLRLRAVF